MRIGKTKTVPRQRCAIIQIADEDILVDVTAVLPSVAVEENVVRHGAAVDTHKDIAAQRALFLWLEIVGSRQAWIDPRRSEIVRQIESDARHRARVRENVHIAERAAQMRVDLHLETQEQRLPETPASLVLEKKGGLVAQLRVPTFRFCIVENFVNELLRLFCKRF